jgi:hypothetical protein
MWYIMKYGNCLTNVSRGSTAHTKWRKIYTKISSVYKPVLNMIRFNMKARPDVFTSL